MSLRRAFLGVASVALAIALIALLISVGKVDLRLTLQQLRSVSWISVTKLVLLNVVLVYCSTEKWRSIDAALRRSSDSTPSRTTSFGLTSAGQALGMLVPVQLAMSTARTLGTYVHGGALKRGTGGTLWEQGFDVLTIGFLAVASGVTRFYRGGGIMWTILAVVAMALALLAVGPSLRVVQWLAASRAARTATPGNRVGIILRGLSKLQQSGLLDAALARRLVMLSVLRFGVTVVMCIQTARAIGLQIPLWQMAAAIPFVAIASAIAFTPGALGVNELTSVTALMVFGTPLAVGAQWALANRVLVVASYFFVAICATLIVFAGKIVAASRRDAMQGR
jgi:uncharacterized membrane protein YbhN (UPF0104 family)